MTIEDLPHYIEHEIEYEDGSIIKFKFFFSINRDAYGKWSVGYVHYASDDLIAGEPDSEMVIPQLYFNSADNLQEIALRMSKLKKLSVIKYLINLRSDTIALWVTF